MFCRTYKCEMPERACILRQQNARREHPWEWAKPGFGDLNCRDCAQGREVAAENGKAMADKDLSSAKTFVERVCARHGLSITFLRSGSRKRKFAKVRADVIPTLRDSYKLNFSQIGGLVGLQKYSVRQHLAKRGLL